MARAGIGNFLKKQSKGGGFSRVRGVVVSLGVPRRPWHIVGSNLSE